MLSDSYSRVKEALDIEAYRSGLVAFANNLDFSTIATTMVIERVQHAPQFITVSNTPDAFLNSFNDVADSMRDPVLQRLKKINCPLLWDQDTYVAGGAGDLWEKQAPFDYRAGIALAMHLPNGTHFYMGVDRRAPLPSDQDRLTRLLADLQLLAVYAQDTSRRLFVKAEGRLPILSKRELEVLGWTMNGKSAWAIARILDVSEHTVHWHAQQAMRKLDCDNKHSAALRAKELGLL